MNDNEDRSRVVAPKTPHVSVKRLRGRPKRHVQPLDTNHFQQTTNLVATQANGEAVNAVDRHVVAQVVSESQSLRKRGRPPKGMSVWC